jgi:hypothetical protein
MAIMGATRSPTLICGIISALPLPREKMLNNAHALFGRADLLNEGRTLLQQIRVLSDTGGTVDEYT